MRTYLSLFTIPLVRSLLTVHLLLSSSGLFLMDWQRASAASYGPTFCSASSPKPACCRFCTLRAILHLLKSMDLQLQMNSGELAKAVKFANSGDSGESGEWREVLVVLKLPFIDL